MSKSCKVVSADGDTMLELKGVRVEGDRLVVTGSLMGAWDADMFLDVDGIKAAVGLVDIPEVIQFIIKNVLEVSITKAD